MLRPCIRSNEDGRFTGRKCHSQIAAGSCLGLQPPTPHVFSKEPSPKPQPAAARDQVWLDRKYKASSPLAAVRVLHWAPNSRSGMKREEAARVLRGF
jgi:hypothetical protein